MVCLGNLKLRIGAQPCSENCRPPANTSGYTVVNGILKAIQGIGPIMLFKAYVDLTLDALNSKTILHSELQSSGVSLTHCPHNGKKDVSDKMMIGMDIFCTLWSYLV